MRIYGSLQVYVYSGGVRLYSRPKMDACTFESILYHFQLAILVRDYAGGRTGPRVNSEKTMFSCDPCRSSASWTLGPPPTRPHAHAPCACGRLLGFAWLQRVQPQSVPRCRGSWKQGASAWRRTIIGEVSQFAPPVAGAITAASQTTETASAAHAARLRRVLAKRHALPTINHGSCSARRICHQQAFAGSQHLVGWR